MTKRRILTPPERAARYAEKAWVRIQMAEATSERKANVELELALAWLAGHTETAKEFMVNRIETA